MESDPETGLTTAQCQDLQALVGIMIPASDEYDVPGADDGAIFDDILRSLGRDLAAVRAVLTQLSTLAGGAFAELGPARQASVAAELLSNGTPDVTALGSVVAWCYYRDDRVVRSHGMEPGPPFPRGHVIEQGDWTLLDPVRSRAKMWRDAP